MEPLLRERFFDTPWLTPVAALALGAAAAWLTFAALDNWRRDDVPVSDRQLRERVRARLSEWVTRPDAVQIAVERGVVRVSGDVPPQERDALLAGLIAVPGVWRVRNALGTATEGA